MFSLREYLLRDLIHHKLKGYQGLSLAWPLPAGAPDRVTIWRWLDRKEVNPDRIFELAGAFDLDPLALFEITPKSYTFLCLRLVKSIGGNHEDALTHDLEWLASFVLPREDWPCSDLASRYFKRPWKVHSFLHTAENARNFFQKLSVTAPPRAWGEPQVWHFAFRDLAPNSLLWIPYGFVERRGGKVALFHYHARGHSAKVGIAPDASTFLVETWFGPSPAEFRVASLHDFKLALCREADPEAPSVRFP